MRAVTVTVTVGAAPAEATARVGKPKPTAPRGHPRIAYLTGFRRFADGHDDDQEKVGRP